MKRPIPYAGFERQNEKNLVPVRRAKELRDQGLGWKQIAQELTTELGRHKPFTADSIYAAVYREDQRKKKQVT